MKPPDVNQTTFQGRPASLARLFSLDERSDALWTPEEIRAIWQHQLSVSLQSELSPGAPVLRSSTAEGGLASPPASHPKNQHAGKDAGSPSEVPLRRTGAPSSAPSSHSSKPKTFGELFADPNPPLDLLKQ